MQQIELILTRLSIEEFKETNYEFNKIKLFGKDYVAFNLIGSVKVTDDEFISIYSKGRQVELIMDEDYYITLIAKDYNGFKVGIGYIKRTGSNSIFRQGLYFLVLKGDTVIYNKLLQKQLAIIDKDKYDEFKKVVNYNIPDLAAITETYYKVIEYKPTKNTIQKYSENLLKLLEILKARSEREKMKAQLKKANATKKYTEEITDTTDTVIDELPDSLITL